MREVGAVHAGRAAFPGPLRDVALAATAAFVILRSVTALWLPFGYDHGMMAATGHVLLDGGMPYRDAWDMKGPVAFFGFAVAEALFGRTMWGIRLVDAAIVLSAAVVLGRFVAAQSTLRCGMAAALGLLVCLASNGWFFTAQPEGWVAAATVLAVLPVLRNRETVTGSRYAISGAMVAVCGLIKPPYFLFGLVPILIALSASSPRLRQARPIGLFLIGVVVPVALVLAFFLVRGALADLLEVHVLYTTRSYTAVNYQAGAMVSALWNESVETLVYVGTGGILPVLCLAPAAALGMRSRARSRDVVRLMLSAWLGIALVCVVVQGKFYPYHWYPVYPPVVALASLALAGLSSRAGATRPVAIGSVVVFLAVASFTPAREVWLTVRHMAGVIDHDDFYGSFQHGYNVRDMLRLTAYLREHSNEGDRLFVWGHEATAIYLSGLSSSTRFVFSLPLADPGPFREQYRREAIGDLRRESPRYILAGAPFEATDDKAKFLRGFPEFESFLRSRYELVARFGKLDLYERADRSI